MASFIKGGNFENKPDAIRFARLRTQKTGEEHRVTKKRNHFGKYSVYRV